MSFYNVYLKAVNGGQFVSVSTEKRLKLKKAIAAEYPGLRIVKKSFFVARTGIDYDNIAQVQEKRASGEKPAENQGLAWGEWETFPYTIQHKGKRYYRFSFAPNTKRETQYLLNGVIVPKDDIKRFCLASEFSTSNSEVFNIAEPNIKAMSIAGQSLTHNGV